MLGVVSNKYRSLVAVMTVLALGVGLAGCGVNNIPTYETAAKSGFAEVQNQYKRRTDLIGNLVETVKGAAQQEQDTLTRVIEARAKATQIKVDASTITDPAKFKEFQDAQDRLGGALGRLLAVSEAYPDLKSNQNFLGLQAELAGTENRIATARRDYNLSVQRYNTELVTIPGRWWRAFMYAGSKEMAFFQASEEDTKAPKVDFGKAKPAPTTKP